jgi:predicted nucleotidyltransferase
MIFLEKKHFEIIKNILDNYPYDFYVFGSRVKGTHRKLSDLDLCIKTSIPFNTKSRK